MICVVISVRVKLTVYALYISDRHAATSLGSYLCQAVSLIFSPSPCSVSLPPSLPLPRYANLFLHPVREDDAPVYRDVIFRPMDLSSIKRSIETGVSWIPLPFTSSSPLPPYLSFPSLSNDINFACVFHYIMSCYAAR